MCGISAVFKLHRKQTAPNGDVNGIDSDRAKLASKLDRKSEKKKYLQSFAGVS